MSSGCPRRPPPPALAASSPQRASLYLRAAPPFCAAAHERLTARAASQADICQLGMDQRKVNMLAREYCDAASPKIKFKPVVLSHREFSGLSIA